MTLNAHHVEGVTANVVGHGDGRAPAGRLPQGDHVEALLAFTLLPAAVDGHHPEAVHGEGPELGHGCPGLHPLSVLGQFKVTKILVETYHFT